jgi:PAS domain S-box-containing protein
LKRWFQPYDNTLETYSQELEVILKKFDAWDLQPEVIESKQKLLLKFTTSKIALELDIFSDNLTQLAETYRQKEKQAKISLEQAEALRNQVIIVSMLLSIASAAALAIYTSHAIARPIEAATEVAKRVTKEANFALQAAVTTNDEVGQLTTSLNQLIQWVATYIQKVNQAQAELDSFFDLSFDLLCITDFSGYLHRVNPAFENTLGYTHEEILSRPFFDYIHPEERAVTIAEFLKLFTSAEVRTYVNRCRCKDGSYKWLEWILVPVPARPLGYAIGRDITKRKQAEEEIRNALEREKELSELKSRFVSMTSHEFRTPLATILSSTEILQRYSQKLSEEKKLEHLQRIQATVKNMTQLLNDVLLIGKAEAGKLDFKPTPLNIVQLCRDLIEEIQISTNTHAIAFCSQGQLTMACMDEKLLRHILSNLLSNAIKYSPSGGTIHFDLVCEQEEVIFRVRDEGIGIPEADRANLFDSFHRASNVGTISGTGLGLAIVKKFVDLHGGQIAVESQVGVGTTFTVTFFFE